MRQPPQTAPDSIFQRSLTLPYSTVGPSGRLRIDRLIRLFQDASSQHSLELGISGLSLKPMNVQWVVSRYQIQVHSTVNWPEPICVKTWRRPWKNLYDLRYLSVENASGREVISGLAVWVMVKMDTGKPLRLTSHLPGSFFDVTPPEPPPFWENGPCDGEIQYQSDFQINPHDLDMNQHVNNTSYVTWALDTLPLTFHEKYIPKKLVISYLKESIYPGNIRSTVQSMDEGDQKMTHHAIYHKNHQTPVSRLTMEWETT